MSTPPKRRILVAEDESLIAMLIEAELTEAGFCVVGPFATCSEASNWLSHDTPDAGVLDHELADGPCTTVALALSRRGVPFVALTGSNPTDLPDILLSATRLAKPNSMERLGATVSKLLSGRLDDGVAGQTR